MGTLKAEVKDPLLAKVLENKGVRITVNAAGFETSATENLVEVTIGDMRTSHREVVDAGRVESLSDIFDWLLERLEWSRRIFVHDPEEERCELWER